jgi:predicted RecB family nuclease
MRITSPIFDAFLKCATKCHLRSRGEIGSGNEYAEWVRGRDESYEREEAQRLQEPVPEAERVDGPPATESLKAAKWRLAVDLVAQTPDRSGDSPVRESRPNEETRGLGAPCSEQLLESRLHAVERVPSEGRGKPAQFVPIRFVFRNKLTKDDRLLLAFDTLVLSQVLGREVSVGKIIHGDDHAMIKVKTAALVGEVRKRLEKTAALFSSPGPPDLILNRHCAECEFQGRCRQKALENDELSLLAHMSATERQELRSKGIFTITQLSYTFRPRRRPKRMRDKREKYHHSLKALAIREKKIHIVGSPELKIDGTPVYLDVEGLPDRDFYYLIGVRIGNGISAVQHSLWADTVMDEGKIWREFLAILETVEKPVLIHYGSYETTFLQRMSERHHNPPQDSAAVKAFATAVNVVTVMFAQIYFPTYSNRLKDVAECLGFKWSELESSGAKAVMWRHLWETTRSPAARLRLTTYNAEDCEALAHTAHTIWNLRSQQAQPDSKDEMGTPVVQVDALKNPLGGKWRVFSSPLKELELINKAAHWEYQRERIYVRSGKRPKPARQRPCGNSKALWRVGKVIECEASSKCPDCHQEGTKNGAIRSVTVQDILFGRFSLKRRVIRYECQPYWCIRCKKTFGLDEKFPKRGRPAKYGRNLLAYLFYQIIDLRIPMGKVIPALSRLFGLNLNPGIVASFKETMAAYYSQTHEAILRRIASGSLVHVDETDLTIKRRRAYVWVFTNIDEVAYLYSETREGELLHTTLGQFRGVLISDFYTIYDSLDCPQQKCLIHLVRDLNEELLHNPYDEEFKQIVKSFSLLLKGMIDDVDRYGLKRHFLKKHLVSVERFYRKVIDVDHQSTAAVACKQRFQKNRDKLFTFLKFDGVPWNNNNAEHAIKAFARLRDFIESGVTEKGIREYLILLSVCQTCKYMGVDFLEFLRSGEKDIHAFAESRRGRRRRTQTSQPTGLPPDVILDTGNQP